jgi:heterodisulfide reductase subunit D
MCKRTLETERLPVIEELRRILAMKGLIPGKAVTRLSRAIEQSQNAYGAPEKKRFQWLDEGRRQCLKERAKTAYFVGCTASYVSPEIARSTVDLLSAAGLEFSLMESGEWCCGNPLLRSGLVEEAQRVMEHNLAAMRERGIEKIVTSCAECYHMWKVDYPRQHDKKFLDYEVLHTTEVLADLIKEGTIKWQKPIEMTVTYHDSCALGRLSEPHEPWAGKRLEYGKLDPPKNWRRGTHGVYAPPRKLLESIPGIKFVEMERVRENSFCCGAGGNVKWTFKDFAVATGVERISEAWETGAQVLAATCPFCKQNLQEAVSHKNIDLEVLDVVEIAVRAL